MADRRDGGGAAVQPALMGERDAARYLGVSAGTLRKTGLPRRVWGSRRLYDRHDLDLFAGSLPYEHEDDAEARKCDEAFD